MKIEIERRLIDFAISIMQICEDLNPSFTSEYLSKQILRSSLSSALNYGEAQSAESRKDFIHKLSIVLKELRETYINLTLIQKAGIAKDTDLHDKVVRENDELIAILFSSLKTAKLKK